MTLDANRIIESADYIRMQLVEVPQFCVVLGSGLGSFGDNLEERVDIPFSEIPHFPESTVEGHKGRLVAGKIEGIRILAMQGRFHYYEGYSMSEVAFPIRCLLQLNVPNLIVTNAAGSVDPELVPGDIMMIRDHIKLHGDSPLRGQNIDAFGPRFNDMSDPYPRAIRTLVRECGDELGIELKEGVYFYMTGPSYETASEIRAIHILGANAVGMSTVPEVIVAAHGGMKVLGLSCITNMGTGMRDQVVGHEEVILRGEAAAGKLMALLRLVIQRWSQRGHSLN